MTGAFDLVVDVWRGDDTGELQRYDVPAAEKQTVLDVVTFIQRRLDPSLAYRFACRVGMCGSCAMTVNGKPRWTCRTNVETVAKGGRLELRPLRNMPVIKDLAVDMAGFFEKWQEAGGRLVPTATRKDAIAKDPAGERRAAGRRCRDRVHQLRHLHRCLRCRRLGPGLSRPRCPEPCLDLAERRSRRRSCRPPGCGRRGLGLPLLSQPGLVCPALPERPQPHGLDRRAQAAGGQGGASGRALSTAAVQRQRPKSRIALRLYILQRATALIMAPLVLVHLAVIVYATQQGLSAEAILGRTQGSLVWAGFYGLFVIAAAIHGTIGLRTVLAETAGWRGRGLDVAMAVFGLGLLVLGLRAVGAVT